MAHQSVELKSISALEGYKLLTNLVVPRPIALVSTIGADGVPNLAPFSFFMLGGSNPASLMISPTLTGKGLMKDTLRNIRETGEFVVNLVNREMADDMNQTSRSLPANESEWSWTKFAALPSSMVKPERVAESPAHLECKLFDVIEHGHGPNAARYVIGEVLMAHFEDAGGGLIARLGGPGYLDLDTVESFELPRP
jgi:flavin reductase (DIM6/NTAB) family NADH-FMN oxidoreductase RutF